MALTSSSLLSPAKAASEHRARRGHQAKGNKSKRGEGEKLALFTGGVQGVDGRAAHSDERHAVCAHLHCHTHHRPRRHGPAVLTPGCSCSLDHGIPGWCHTDSTGTWLVQAINTRRRRTDSGTYFNYLLRTY